MCFFMYTRTNIPHTTPMPLPHLPPRSASDLYRVLDKCKVGEQVAIEVLRDSAKENVTVTLEANT